MNPFKTLVRHFRERRIRKLRERIATELRNQHCGDSSARYRAQEYASRLDRLLLG